MADSFVESYIERSSYGAVTSILEHVAEEEEICARGAAQLPTIAVRMSIIEE